MRAASSQSGTSDPMSRIATPTVSAAAPPTVVDQPVMRPRRPFSIVRPITSLLDSELSDRATASTASASTTARPPAGPSATSARTPIAAAASPWTTEPSTHTPARCRLASSHGASAAWGSMDPASRTGTSSAMSRLPAPIECSSHGSTVFGFTSWSPTPWSPWETTKRRPFRCSTGSTGSGVVCVSGIGLLALGGGPSILPRGLRARTAPAGWDAGVDSWSTTNARPVAGRGRR